MAAFCKQCSMELYGDDYQDLAMGFEHMDLCEGCGEYVLVDANGRCIDQNCPKHGVNVEKKEQKSLAERILAGEKI